MATGMKPLLSFKSLIKHLFCLHVFLVNLRFFMLQVSMAYKHGAKGVILYSDPADYAPDGYYSWWLPPNAVQRGSVYPGPTFGDPLTHGLPSIPGMSRSSRDNVGLPKIPVHVITYKEAKEFLHRMKGAC